MVDWFPTLLSVALLWSVAVMTPGPNFFVILQNSARYSRKTGCFIVAGVVAGTSLWGFTGVWGINTLFEAAPWLYAFLRLLGGGYLVVRGITLIAGKHGSTPSASYPSRSSMRPVRAIRLGFLTSLSNPKTAAFVASLVASTMPETPSLGLGMAGVVLMMGISLLWYGVVVFLFSSRYVASFYKRRRTVIERVTGIMFIGFGTRVALQR